MSQAIDILIIDPLHEDARKTSAAIRTKAPKASVVRVMGGDQAAHLMFEQGLFTREPQLPRLIIADLAAAGESAKAALRRLKGHRPTLDVPVVIFSARRNAKDILDSHLLGADMNLLKPTATNDYAAAVERIVTIWRAGRLLWRPQQAG